LCKRPLEFPAIIHADGTSRVQTVSRTDSPYFYEFLQEWYRETGCPMVLNTSLNIKGKPMVNNQKDAKDFANHYSIPVHT
jgi:carbamoyltransferase